MKFILIIFLAFFLQGCGTFKSDPEIFIPEAKIAYIDPKLLELCSPIPTVKVAKFLDAVQAYSALASQYVECANKHVDLVTITKELGNIK